MNRYKKIIIVLICIGLILDVFGFFWKKICINNYPVSNRANNECTTTKRVFDYANVLSNKEEKKLTDLINKSEKQIGADIVIVTIKDSNIADMETYADKFYDKYNFGWNKARGDGVLYADNWQGGHCWFCTTGKFIKTYNTKDKINSIIDATCEHVNSNPYKGYKTFVEKLVSDEVGIGIFPYFISVNWILVVSVVITAIFVIINIVKDGKNVDPTKYTYVKGGCAKILGQTNTFLSKHVTSRVIQNNSSGGGSGSHTSDSGTTHGGGGGKH